MNFSLKIHLSFIQWILASISALLLGFSKTGINGVGTLSIPVMAGIFGGKASAGIVLPMLITGDLIAVKHYSKHTNWLYIWRLAPWTLGGLVTGLLVGNIVNDNQFKAIIAVSVLISLGIMIWIEQKNGKANIPDQWWVSALIGLAGGFTTMIGNAAGPVMTVYLLSMKLPKYDFIGTGAWFFALLNITKLPLQIIFWGTITAETLTFNTLMIPFIAIGALLGILAVKIIPEKPFRITVMVLTAISAIRLFF